MSSLTASEDIHQYFSIHHYGGNWDLKPGPSVCEANEPSHGVAKYIEGVSLR